MGGYYDDNYGMWHDMDPRNPDYEENQAFYRQVQDTNVSKKCSGCGQQVRIQPQYAYCSSCADTLERGGELPSSDGDEDDGEGE